MLAGIASKLFVFQLDIRVISEMIGNLMTSREQTGSYNKKHIMTQI